MSVVLGHGDGTFQAQFTLPVAGLWYWLEVGDFNGDAKPDLASAFGEGTMGSHGVTVLHGNGDGTFQTEKRFNTYTVKAMATGDFNGDGNDDIVVTMRNSIVPTNAYASVLLGNADGTFQPQVAYDVKLSVYVDESAVRVSDADGDGKLDIFTMADGGPMTVLLGSGDGTFPIQKTFDVNAAAYPLAVGDVDGDGKPDAVGKDNDLLTWINKSP